MFQIPERVVALHSWVWWVSATETVLLQREILEYGLNVVLNFTPDGAADTFLCLKISNMQRIIFAPTVFN